MFIWKSHVGLKFHLIKRPIWNPYCFDFHFASIHVSTSKGLTEHRKEIFNWNEISCGFEFISRLTWTYSKESLGDLKKLLKWFALAFKQLVIYLCVYVRCVQNAVKYLRLFVKIISNFHPFTILEKSTILDV